MSLAAIQINDLYKSYKQGWRDRTVQAVDGISLEIQPGEIWALAGPNGAGKTTTLNCLFGLIRPDRGNVRIFGLDPTLPEARQKLGFQSEIFFTYPYLTARQALVFYGRLSGLDGLMLDRTIDELLEKLGLTHARDQRTAGFSKGMMQRLGLAQSLLHDPELIVWDEPSTGLDPEGRRLVTDLLADFKKRGKTVLLSTHILSDIERACDHVAIIALGQIQLASDMQELLARSPGKSLEDIYLHTVKRQSHA